MSLSTSQTKFADTLGNYLIRIGRIPLLTPEQEIKYAKQVQQMMKLLKIEAELTQNSTTPPSTNSIAAAANITVPQLQEIIRQGEIAKRKMLEANLRLVVAIAKKYQNLNIDILDLIQEGNIGLQKGIEKFDPNMGYRFSTYAYWWIRQAMTRAIDQSSRTIRLPIHICGKLKKIKHLQREFYQQYGKPPSIKQLAEELDLEPEQIQTYLRMSGKPVSLDVRIGDDGQSNLQDVLEDTNSSLEQQIDDNSLQEYIQQLLSELTSQQREVLTLRYGLSSNRQLTLTEVAKRMNIPSNKARQLQRQAIARLRRKKRDIRLFLQA
ncbi:RNA polymerase sigma factor, RpoD/SigA family [Calothrix sp. NIES-3974]|uniref:RNA polymerase sigma factor, RpoD/SigA family n=1 Tax=Calothrix sp. NIES-3974 TaxID=2005462 RepID=UPI000B5F176D|nr:RNA polymerase sigma factor, RpoD/SigA family [Calothrix sp. NIES-3974]BAZ03868.1 group 2 RNA polymerase sigma factor SigB [Calothrix sp. NIES-3974]